MSKYEFDYLLFSHKGDAKAADARGLSGTGFPRTIFIGDREYRIVSGEETFIFWEELVDDQNQVVGFWFILPDSPTFRSSRLIQASANAIVKHDEVCIDLCPGVQQQWGECIQAFGSEVYQAVDDPKDCAILMLKWSERTPGFKFVAEEVRAIP